MKHFILNFDPESAENALPKINSKINSIIEKVEGVDNSFVDISNYITKLDDLEKLVVNKIETLNVPSTHISMDAELTARISNLESLTTQLNKKMDSISTIPTPDHPSSRHPSRAHNLSEKTPSNPCSSTLLILGDSNTRHINIDDSTRIPTMLIEDIDPTKCKEFKKIWVHVGINNLKSINCRGPDDDTRHFHNFMNKLSTIRSICPNSQIIISPILPTNIIELNMRAKMFNKILFSSRTWFIALDFNQFWGDRLMRIYRSYKNPGDNIHPGVLGIQVLASKVRNVLKFTDTRSYSQALRPSQPRHYAT